MKNLFVESLALIRLFFVIDLFFYFTTLPLNKHRSRTTILLCSLIIVKSNYKMKVFFSPFGYITWKVNDN